MKKECQHFFLICPDIYEGTKTDAGVRIVSIPECNVSWVEEVIEAAHQYSDTWLFPQEPGKWKKRYTGQRIRTSQLRQHLRDICENELHIEYKSPHKLRKTYASILAANNVPDTMRIAQMGHTDIKTTKQFYEFDRETNAEKAQKLGEIEELRLLFEDIFFVPPTVLENLPFRGGVALGTRNFSPLGLKKAAFSGDSLP